MTYCTATGAPSDRMIGVANEGLCLGRNCNTITAPLRVIEELAQRKIGHSYVLGCSRILKIKMNAENGFPSLLLLGRSQVAFFHDVSCVLNTPRAQLQVINCKLSFDSIGLSVSQIWNRDMLVRTCRGTPSEIYGRLLVSRC